MADERTSRADYRTELTAKIIDLIENGKAPWQKPWRAGEAPGQLPMNAATGKAYRGGNRFWLMARQDELGSDDPRWMTLNQANAAGYKIAKGAKSTSVEYWQFTKEETRDGPNGPEKVTVELDRPRVFYARVFNACQIEGIPPMAKAPERSQNWSTEDAAERALTGSGARIFHDQRDGAYYRPSTDSIHLPQKESFATALDYYEVALHELGHWTGHPSRLNRDLTGRFGTADYAKEELRAQMASLFLAAELGLPFNPDRHAAYNRSWLGALKDDKNLFFQAARDAEQIADYVMDLALERERKPEQRVPGFDAPAAPESRIFHRTDRGPMAEGVTTDPAFKGQIAELARGSQEAASLPAFSATSAIDVARADGAYLGSFVGIATTADGRSFAIQHVGDNQLVAHPWTPALGDAVGTPEQPKAIAATTEQTIVAVRYADREPSIGELTTQDRMKVPHDLTRDATAYPGLHGVSATHALAAVSRSSFLVLEDFDREKSQQPGIAGAEPWHKGPAPMALRSARDNGVYEGPMLGTYVTPAWGEEPGRKFHVQQVGPGLAVLHPDTPALAAIPQGQAVGIAYLGASVRAKIDLSAERSADLKTAWDAGRFLAPGDALIPPMKGVTLSAELKAKVFELGGVGAKVYAGRETDRGSRYAGTIVAMDADTVIQQLKPGSYIAHDRKAIERSLGEAAIGEKINVAYTAGRVVATGDTAREKGPEAAGPATAPGREEAAKIAERAGVTGTVIPVEQVRGWEAGRFVGRVVAAENGIVLQQVSAAKVIAHRIPGPLPKEPFLNITYRAGAPSVEPGVARSRGTDRAR